MPRYFLAMTKDHSESVHERLNRELNRYYLGDWRLRLTCLGALAVLFWMLIPEPRSVDFHFGRVTGTTILVTEAGPRIRVGVQLGETRVEAGTRAQLIAPAKGETVCVRRMTGEWTGRTRYAIATLRECSTQATNLAGQSPQSN